MAEKASFAIDALVERLRLAAADDQPATLARLFEIAQETSGLRYDVLRQCLVLVEDGTLTAAEVAPCVSVIKRIWNAVRDQVAPLQQKGAAREWMLEDEYREPRAVAGVALDFMGHLPREAVLDALQEGLGFPDPWLKLFAAVSLLRQRESVDGAEIERIAADSHVRIIFWEKLREQGLEYLMPARWSRPEALAASDLVRWAAYPTELGFPPEDIELMQRCPVEMNGQMLEAYLFRFREYPRPWAPGEGWMAGVAGPYRNGEALGSPWSSFDRWDSMSPEEHFLKLFRISRPCGLP